MSFVVALPVRFADCDPAGIGYFPRLLALVDAAVEDWTAAVLGADRAELHQGRRLGLPTVSLQTAFRAAVRLGDRLELEVQVERVGRSSITLLVCGRVAQRLCLEARLVQVLTDLETMRPSPWPDAWRAALQPVPDLETALAPVVEVLP